MSPAVGMYWPGPGRPIKTKIPSGSGNRSENNPTRDQHTYPSKSHTSSDTQVAPITVEDSVLKLLKMGAISLA